MDEQSFRHYFNTLAFSPEIQLWSYQNSLVGRNGDDTRQPMRSLDEIREKAAQYAR